MLIRPGGDGVGQLIAAHVHGDHRQRRDRGVGAERREEGADAVHDQVRDDRDCGHDASLGEKHRADGVNAVDEFASQLAFRFDDRRQRTDQSAGHDDIDDEITELSHGVPPAMNVSRASAR